MRQLIKDGDRIFGYALVLCPDCKATRPYWIYVEYGKAGWYCEMPTPIYPQYQSFWVDVEKQTNAYLDKLAPLSCRVRLD